MSQTMRIINKIASILNHKPSDSASSRPSRVVRDSHQTIEGRCITNIPAGTITELNNLARGQAEYDFSRAGVGSARRHGRAAPYYSVVTSVLPRKTYSCLPSESLCCRPLMLLASIIPAIMLASFLYVSDSHATASTIGITISGNPTVDIQSTTDGAFADSGNSTITITTTHAAGYTLTAKASSATSLTGTKGGSLASLDTGTSIDANTFNTSTYNDKWGYKPSKYNSTTNTTYRPSPGLGTTASPLDTLDVTNNSNNGSYTVSIGARVSTNTDVDSYSNQFVFAVTGNPTPYAITYNKNTTNTVSNMPSNHTTSDTGAAGETVTLASNTPTRTGYTFNGWCTTTPTTSAGIDSCSGTKYNAGGTWTINQTSTSNSLTLYAMWNRASYNVKVNFAGSGVSSVSFAAAGYTTRTVSSSGGTANLMYGVQYTVTMSLSSTSYAFDKWALNSSSYGTLSSTTANPTYFTPNTSSASAIITATGAGGKPYIQDFSLSMCQTQASLQAITVIDERDNQEYTVRYINGGCWMTRNLAIGCNGSGNTYGSSANAVALTAEYSNLNTTWNTPTASLVNYSYSTTGYTTPAMKCNSTYGAWYNYAAASAGTITGNPNIDINYYDICPKNWSLPSGVEFDGIVGYASDLALVGGGYYYNGSLFGTSSGYWWSSDVLQGDGAKRVYLQYNNNSLSIYGNDRYRGYYVRCVRTK